MDRKQVSDNGFAVLDEKKRICDANSGLINLGGGANGPFAYVNSFNEWREGHAFEPLRNGVELTPEQPVHG